MNLLQELRERGLVEQVTHEAELSELLEGPQTALYVGFDPTATSLHMGNMVPMMVAAHAQRRGHRPILLVGGATGMIGDPSGKDQERNLQSEERIAENVAGIRAQLESFLTFEGESAASLVNNRDWIGPFSFLEWLRDVGKYFTINYMISKESVKRRLENREQGISYTEFSYMMLQAYDFLHLFREKGCKLQVGGSDQWGNITAGTDLIHKAAGERAFGLTVPLMTTSSGEKFGKSAGNAVWLDPEQTSPYLFYQYWIQTDDRDVDRWLKAFTFLSLDEIQSIVDEHMEAPHKRLGQKRLAKELTLLVHGEAGLQSAEQATQIFFGGAIEGLSDKELGAIFADVPSTDLSRADLAEGMHITDLLAATACKSKGEARRLLKQGGVNVNNKRVDGERVLGLEDLASETCLVLRMGKKKYHVVRFN